MNQNYIWGKLNDLKAITRYHKCLKLSNRVTGDDIPVTTKEMCIAPKAGKMKCRMTMQIAAQYLNVMPVVDTEYAQVQIFVHVRSAGKKGIKCSAKM